MTMMPIICKEVMTKYVFRFVRPYRPKRSTLQDYGFDYSDNEDANESGSVDVENMYYKAKCMNNPSAFDRI